MMRFLALLLILFGCTSAWAITTVNPGDDLAALAQAAPEGEQFTLVAGMHRTGNVVPKNGQIFTGLPGAVMSGAKVVQPSTWVQGPNFWVSYGHAEAGQVHGTCNVAAFGNACKYPEELWMDGVRLQQVIIDIDTPGEINGGQTGTWFFDYPNDAIYVFDDPTDKAVEMSSLRFAFTGAASNVTIRHLTIQRYANPAQHGAVHGKDGTSGPLSNGWVVENNIIQGNHGVGVKIGHGMIVRSNVIQNNVQLGIGGSGDGVVVQNNDILNNHDGSFSIEWEAGGSKFAQTNGLLVTDNRVLNNHGPGLWTDIDNLGTTYSWNYVSGNFWAGIFHEISFAASIHNNWVVGNGFGKPSWGWGAGILISASKDTEVYDNFVIDNADGITVLQQDRGPTHLVENVFVHHNTIAMRGTGADVGQSGLDADNGDTGILARNNVFDYNLYIVDGDTWRWLLEQTPPETSGNRKWDAWQAAGMDANGTRYILQP